MPPRPRVIRPQSRHDLTAVVRLDRVNAPKQARSTASMQRILGALEKLLETKPFDAITIANIDASAFERELDVGVRAAYALLHQRLLFHPISLGRSMADEREFAADLALVIRRCVGRH